MAARTLKQIKEDIREFSEGNFGKRTDATGPLNHLKREIEELLEVLGKGGKEEEEEGGDEYEISSQFSDTSVMEDAHQACTMTDQELMEAMEIFIKTSPGNREERIAFVEANKVVEEEKQV